MRFRRPSPDEEEPAENRIDALVALYGDGGRFDELRRALDALDVDKLSQKEAEDWYHLRGIVEFRTGRRPEARRWFGHGLEQFPGSPELRFSLGQELEFVGDIDGAASLWRDLGLRDVGGATILAVARYFYLWSLIEEADRTIAPIFDAYYSLGIADDTFLSIRGLPFFAETFACRATFALVAGEPRSAERELERASAELSDCDFEHLRLELQAAVSSDWSAVIERGRRELDWGLGTMQSAVHASRLAGDETAAEAELAAVVLHPLWDFPWLEDVRLLARAEAAQRLDRRAREEELLAVFFRRQPLLFEPNHAFTFGFIEYQEELKPRYQALRREAGR